MKVGVVGSGRVEQSLHFLAGEPRKQSDTGDRCLLSRNAELVRGDVHVGVLGDIDERLERHMIAEQDPEQRAQDALDRYGQGLADSRLRGHRALHDLGNISQIMPACQAARFRWSVGFP